jgi:Ulp1 family protease
MYLKAIESYLKKEYNKLYKPKTLFYKRIKKPIWKFSPCPKGSDVPIQAKGSNDCGVFVCFFMDIVMSNCPVSLFTEEAIQNDYGRDWLCLSLVEKKIMF